MQYERAYSFLINKLENGLPTYITYHDAQHTKNVIAAAEHLATGENIIGDELVLLKTAALFHDAGFLQNHHDHEELSCKIARKHLPEFEYTPEQIDSICRMILTTKLPQTAPDHLSQLLCDADLYYLGGDDYAANAEKLFNEFKKNGIINTATEWEMKQADFLSAHRYFTPTAIREREEKKQQTLQELKSKIANTFTQPQKNHPLEMIQDAVLVICGVVIAGFALKGFLVPNHFFDGGITGISLLIHELYHINLAIAIIVLNLPLIIISYFTVGHRFAYRTLISVILLGVCL